MGIYPFLLYTMIYWLLSRTWLFINVDLNLLGVLPAVVKGISPVHFKVEKGFDSCSIQLNYLEIEGIVEPVRIKLKVYAGHMHKHLSSAPSHALLFYVKRLSI